MSRVRRFLGGAAMATVAAAAIGLGAAAPASATTVTDSHSRPPSPISVLVGPFTLGMHVIDKIAEGIADAVEFIATPAPIAIPAPHSST